MRPKGLTADIFGRNFGQFSAKTVSALLAGFGHTAEMEFSAETAIFGRKKLVSAKIFECHSVKIDLLIQGTTNFP